MDGLSLDHGTVAEQTDDVRYTHDDAWLARRALRMGASDIPALLLAYDPRPEEERAARRYQVESARIVKTRRGDFPLVIARKAGLRRPQSRSVSMTRGQVREVELLRRWSVGAREIVESSLVLASEMPRWARHAIDHECPALAATLDAYGVDVFGDEIPIEGKCPRGSEDALPWFWRAQLLGQIAVTSAPAGVVVCGPGWGASDDGGGEPVSWVVERDDTEIARIREVCRRGAADLARAMEDA